MSGHVAVRVSKVEACLLQERGCGTPSWGRGRQDQGMESCVSTARSLIIAYIREARVGVLAPAESGLDARCVGRGNVTAVCAVPPAVQQLADVSFSEDSSKAK